jgi:hypothetical protein
VNRPNQDCPETEKDDAWAMIRLLMFVGIVHFFHGSLFAAQMPEVAWVFQAGGSRHDKIRAVTVDKAGNTFSTGEFTEDAVFGEHSVKSAGGLDFVLAKLDAQGGLVWVVSAGGAKTDRWYAVAVSEDGSVYVTGHFESETIRFGETTLHNRGQYDVFIVKYSAHGAVVWARSAGGSAYDFGHGLAVTSSGKVLVSGSVRGEGDFGADQPVPSGNIGPFVAAYSPAGDLEWLRCMTGRGSGSGHELAVNGQGRVFLGGYFSGTAELGGHALAAGRRDLFAACLSQAGDVEWVFQGGGTSDGLVSGIAADTQGGCYLSGMFKGTPRMVAQTWSSAGDNDLFLAKLDPKGHAVWSFRAGGPGVDYGLGVATDRHGNALLTGETTGDVTLGGSPLRGIGKRDLYAAKFGADGSSRWVWQAGGTLNALSYAAGCGPGGLNVIAGAFSGELVVAGKKWISRGSNDAIVIGLRD